jgi:hypothetical protein
MKGRLPIITQIPEPGTLTGKSTNKEARKEARKDAKG